MKKEQITAKLLALALPLTATLFSGFVFLKVLSNPMVATWRIVAAAVGFSGFFIFSLLVLYAFKKAKLV